MAEFEFLFDVVRTYRKKIVSDDLPKAMQEFKRWYQTDSDLNQTEIEEEELRDLCAVWELKDDGEHEPRWTDVFQWGTVIPKGGCTIENFEWIEGE